MLHRMMLGRFATMRHVTCLRPGGVEVLSIAEAPIPVKTCARASG